MPGRDRGGAARGAMLTEILQHLTALVGFDTQNPPRRPAPGLFDYLEAALPGFVCTRTDYGAGAQTFLAQRGKPDTLFNFHLDTVPRSPAWTRDPFELLITDQHAIGLGACDIKGAAACMLAAAKRTTGDLALLFSTDEEANDPRCIAGFLASQPSMRKAIVAEPTGARAVLAHRGIASVEIQFAGVAGHASERRTLDDNALHRAVTWGQAALSYARSFEGLNFGVLSGLRFNIGRVEGGIKANVIAPNATLRFGFRPLPLQSVDELLTCFRQMAPPAQISHFQELFRGPPLPAASGADATLRLDVAQSWAEQLGLPLGPAVDFWTEAALFSAADWTAMVYGPGSIAQAHSADEYVELGQLNEVFDNYLRIIDRGSA